MHQLVVLKKQCSRNTRLRHRPQQQHRNGHTGSFKRTPCISFHGATDERVTGNPPPPRPRLIPGRGLLPARRAWWSRREARCSSIRGGLKSAAACLLARSLKLLELVLYQEQVSSVGRVEWVSGTDQWVFVVAFLLCQNSEAAQRHSWSLGDRAGLRGFSGRSTPSSSRTSPSR